MARGEWDGLLWDLLQAMAQQIRPGTDAWVDRHALVAVTTVKLVNVPVSSAMSRAIAGEDAIRLARHGAKVKEEQLRRTLRAKIVAMGRFVDPDVLALKMLLVDCIHIIPREMVDSARCICSQ